MATGAFSSCTISPNGCQATVVFDAPTPNSWAGSYTYDTTKCTFSVVSEGYSAGVLGTVNRAVGVASVASESVNGSNQLEVIVNLEDQVYDDDSNGGAGTSGTDPTITLTAGFVTDGDSDTSGATTATSCTNSSTLDYPKAIGRIITIPFQMFAGTFDIEAVAFHRYGIDQIDFTLTDSAVATDTQTATAVELVSAVGAHGPATQYGAWTVTFDSSSFADGAGYVEAEIYPTVGDADAVLSLTDSDITGWTPRCDVYLNDGGSRATYYAYVDASAGNDTTGVASTNPATAEASPCLTIGVAAKKIYTAYGDSSCDGGVIRLVAGSHNWGSQPFPYPAASESWLTITRDPNATRANTKLTTYTDGIRCGRVRVHDLTLDRTGQSSNTLLLTPSGEGHLLWMSDCDCIPVGSSTTTGLTNGWGAVFYTGVKKSGFYNAFSGHVVRDCLVDGCWSDHYTNSRCIVNCKSDGAYTETGAHADIWQLVLSSATPENLICYGLEVLDVVQCQGIPYWAAGDGYTIVKNSAVVNVSVPADGTAAKNQFDSVDLENVLFLNCTILDGTAFRSKDRAATYTSLLFKGCVFGSMTIQNETYGQPTIRDAWFKSNHYIDATGQYTMQPGTDITTGSTESDLFADPSSDDYHPKDTAGLDGRLSSPQVTYDIEGTVYSGTRWIGAFEYEAGGYSTTGGKVLI